MLIWNDWLSEVDITKEVSFLFIARLLKEKGFLNILKQLKNQSGISDRTFLHYRWF
ncbi:Uncharacterised protein [Actinobacillus equuli]|nr:Uncharacterised protein [Actinobacillus equuli]